LYPHKPVLISKDQLTACIDDRRSGLDRVLRAMTEWQPYDEPLRVTLAQINAAADRSGLTVSTLDLVPLGLKKGVTFSSITKSRSSRRTSTSPSP